MLLVSILSLLLLHILCDGEYLPQNMNACLGQGSPTNANLQYPDGSMRPIRIPNPLHTSGKISALISNILLSEILGYSTIFVDESNLSSRALFDVAGCAGASLIDCDKWELENPKIHFAVEVSDKEEIDMKSLSINVQPILLNILGYDLDDGYFFWDHINQQGRLSECPSELSHFESYNASSHAPHKYFDSWDWFLDEIPEHIFVNCSDIFSGAFSAGLSTSAADAKATYTLLTNDTHFECHADRVWFSPACRQNTSLCVPLVLYSNFDWAMQRAALLNMPLAVALLRTDYADPTSPARPAILRGRLLFQARLPTDTLLDRDGTPPVLLRLPRQDVAEQARGIYRTGVDGVRARTYGWRYLPQAGPAVHALLARMDFTGADVAGFMARSAALRAAGAAPDDAARRVACEWLRGAGAARWPAWIPAACPVGFYPDDGLGRCPPCPAGFFCPAGVVRPASCPPDAFCPAGAGAPVPCPGGRGTVPEGGAEAADGCARCPAGGLAILGACVAAAVLLPALVIPLAALVAAAAAWRCMRREAQSHRALRRRVAALRARLGLERRDGYVLRCRSARGPRIPPPPSPSACRTR